MSETLKLKDRMGELRGRLKILRDGLEEAELELLLCSALALKQPEMDESAYLLTVRDLASKVSLADLKGGLKRE